MSEALSLAATVGRIPCCSAVAQNASQFRQPDATRFWTLPDDATLGSAWRHMRSSSSSFVHLSARCIMEVLRSTGVRLPIYRVSVNVEDPMGDLIVAKTSDPRPPVRAPWVAQDRDQFGRD